MKFVTQLPVSSERSTFKSSMQSGWMATIENVWKCISFVVSTQILKKIKHNSPSCFEMRKCWIIFKSIAHRMHAFLKIIERWQFIFQNHLKGMVVVAMKGKVSSLLQENVDLYIRCLLVIWFVSSVGGVSDSPFRKLLLRDFSLFSIFFIVCANVNNWFCIYMIQSQIYFCWTSQYCGLCKRRDSDIFFITRRDLIYFGQDQLCILLLPPFRKKCWRRAMFRLLHIGSL